MTVQDYALDSLTRGLRLANMICQHQPLKLGEQIVFLRVRELIHFMASALMQMRYILTLSEMVILLHNSSKTHLILRPGKAWQYLVHIVLDTHTSRFHNLDTILGLKDSEKH